VNKSCDTGIVKNAETLFWAAGQEDAYVRRDKMRYFSKQEQAVELFDKVKPIAAEHKVIFLIVKSQKDVKPLISDMIILLQRFQIKVQKDGLKICGTTHNPSKTIKVLVDDEQKLKGISESQIIRL
jgi:hypothetical protein